MKYKINADRLMRNLFEMAKIGMNENGGIDREFGSEADAETREWLKEYWNKNIGLTAATDAIANLRIQRSGTEALLPIVMGSHHDAVPDGGKYDGAMGVLIATEIMQTIAENEIKLRHPFQVISFTGEEPSPFNLSTLGSKVICGKLKKEDLFDCRHRETGELLSDAIGKVGGDIAQLEEARLQKGAVAAFLEAHNELGGYLEEEGLSIASVSHITGIYREEIRIYGEANHAGTTMMQNRKDAMLALSELALKIEAAAKEFHDPNVVATVGYVKIIPNEANIIAGEAKAIVDIRTYKKEKLEEILVKIQAAVKEIEESRKVTIKRKELLNQPCQKLDDEIRAAIGEGILQTGEVKKQMISMAGHDAANMGLLTKAGMIFVKSVGGMGHCRQEYSRKEDIVKAADALFYTLIKLDKELD